MKYSIVYSSITGNTELLARRILSALPKNDLIYCGEPSEKALASDLIFVGFWTLKGGCDETIKKFLTSLGGKKLFLFGTAGFGGSVEYFDGILSRVLESVPAETELYGSYMCQGKMPQETCLKYRTLLLNRPNDTPIMRMIDNFDRAKTHPDENDLLKLDEVIRQTIQL